MYIICNYFFCYFTALKHCLYLKLAFSLQYPFALLVSAQSIIYFILYNIYVSICLCFVLRICIDNTHIHTCMHTITYTYKHYSMAVLLSLTLPAHCCRPSVLCPVCCMLCAAPIWHFDDIIYISHFVCKTATTAQIKLTFKYSIFLQIRSQQTLEPALNDALHRRYLLSTQTHIHIYNTTVQYRLVYR